MKKILLSATAAATALAMVPMFAAFEAHVVNVTARIENALEVPLEALNFGTVFPQEQLEKELSVALSQSFLDEPRVDDVKYFIRQKPKCAVTSDNGTVLVGPTWTGHVIPVPPAQGTEGWTYRVDCEQDKPELPNPLPQGQTYGELPSLCQYISKHPDNQPGNDGSLSSFHQPFTINSDGTINWNDVDGYLAQSAEDISDTWTIDLKVPCFGGFCAQDWAAFVAANDGDNNANPADYTQPIENEHKVFGCNLWVEVSSVSEMQPTRVSSGPMQFGPNGWGGWSCPAGTHVVGGGYLPGTATVQISEAAEPGSVSGLYPVYPHYSFPAGETGWVVQNNNDGESIEVFADCLPN